MSDIRNVFDQEGVEAVEVQPPLDDRKTIFIPGINVEVLAVQEGGVLIKGRYSETLLHRLSHLVVQDDYEHPAVIWPTYDH